MKGTILFKHISKPTRDDESPLVCLPILATGSKDRLKAVSSAASFLEAVSMYLQL